jgi:ABC-2 type transport system ATP-binding protein
MLIERFGIDSFLDTQVRKLSLGQRMRAEIAASLLHQPKILFLDEPTIGLDVMARQELRDLISEWNTQEGMTVFLTSHDAGDIESVARRVIVVNHGRIVLDDKVSSMRRQYLSSKVLSVKFHDQPAALSMAGVTVIKSSNHALKLEVDTALVPIQAVMNEVLKAGDVADITIENPPLEEVIAHIYSQPAKEQAQAQDTEADGSLATVDKSRIRADEQTRQIAAKMDLGNDPGNDLEAIAHDHSADRELP